MFNTLPTRFRHYEVLRELGSGGFGVVYLARDTNLKRLVVLKMLHPHLATRPDVVRRFLREAQAMAGLDHANIVRINRVENDPQLPFFEMEYVEGQTLAQYRGQGMLPLPEAMAILAQMAAALDAAHQQKIVHRDVKPGNVLIKPDNTLKLTDFGIIKLLEPTGTVHPSTRDIIGTPSYMAPEQVDINRKGEIGPATDIYALGVVAYQLLTGHLPFSGGPAPAILHAHAYTPPPDPRTFNRYLPHAIAQVLLKALAKSPHQRYPSAMAFVNALEQAALGNAVPPPNTGSFVSAPAPVTPATPVTPIPPVTPPFASQRPSVTPSSPPAISKSIMVGFIVVVLIAMIVGGLLREFFTTSPESEPGIVQTPIASAQSPVATPSAADSAPDSEEPTTAPDLLTATSVSFTATSVSLTATSVSFTATLGPTEPATGRSEPPTATSEPPTATSEPPTATPVPPTATPVPPAPEPTLGIRSTIPGQDGMTLLYVPAGEFLMGSDADDPVASDDEDPQRSVYLDAFWIDQTEVTNEMFAAFLNQQGNQIEGDVTWLDINDEHVLISESAGAFEPKEGFANHPVIEVTWYGANAYCEWAGRELPTETQWEKAARGTDGRTYPWGNDSPTQDLLNFNWNVGDTTEVGSYPDGASPYQALDMAGNVWEWVADWYDADYYNDAPSQNPTGPEAGTQKALRGGSWPDNEARIVRAGFRNRGDPAVSNDSWGFRCARSP